MRCLVTGGCGFIGSNLAETILRKRFPLLILDNLSRIGSDTNLKWLKTKGHFDFVHDDIRNENIKHLILHYQPDVIFHLAGQVAMTTSINHPRADFEINSLGTLNVLEAVRLHCKNAIMIYSSTNKVYGDLAQFETLEDKMRYVVKDFSHGFDESLTLNFHSPYGCSKGAADQYMLDYARIYGLKTLVFRHSSIFGVRQFSTYDQGWVGWFVKQALASMKEPHREAFTISGNGKQVRDILFSEDIVNCYFMAIDHIHQCQGQAFNIGGGYDNSLSILELLNFLEQELDVKLNFTQLPWRQSDQKVFIANINKAKKYFSWLPTINKETGLRMMIEWMKQHA